MKRGEIRLAALNPSKGAEPGKVRPVLIYQTDMLNTIDHPTTVILPLTTNLIDDTFPLRHRIEARGNLEQDSDLLIDQIRAVDNRRIIGDVVATLGENELLEIDEMVNIVLGM